MLPGTMAAVGLFCLSIGGRALSASVCGTGGTSRRKALCSSDRGTDGDGISSATSAAELSCLHPTSRAAANLNLLPNPNLVLLAHAIVQGAFSTDFGHGTSSWIWVQLVGFLITICLVLHNFHLDGMKCRCLTLALTILQLSASCGFCVVLLSCLCAWMFPLFPAGPPVPSKESRPLRTSGTSRPTASMSDFRRYKIDDPGNCQFAAVAHLTEDTAASARQKAVDKMQEPEHRDRFREAILNSLVEDLESPNAYDDMADVREIQNTDKKLKAYLNKMRRNGTWGDQNTLQALAEVYRSPIYLFNQTGGKTNEILPNESGNVDPICLCYYQGTHYDALVPIPCSTQTSQSHEEDILEHLGLKIRKPVAEAEAGSNPISGKPIEKFMLAANTAHTWSRSNTEDYTEVASTENNGQFIDLAIGSRDNDRKEASLAFKGSGQPSEEYGTKVLNVTVEKPAEDDTAVPLKLTSLGAKELTFDVIARTLKDLQAQLREHFEQDAKFQKSLLGRMFSCIDFIDSEGQPLDLSTSVLSFALDSARPVPHFLTRLHVEPWPEKLAYVGKFLTAMKLYKLDPRSEFFDVKWKASEAQEVSRYEAKRLVEGVLEEEKCLRHATSRFTQIFGKLISLAETQWHDFMVVRMLKCDPSRKSFLPCLLHHWSVISRKAATTLISKEPLPMVLRTTPFGLCIFGDAFPKNFDRGLQQRMSLDDLFPRRIDWSTFSNVLMTLDRDSLEKRGYSLRDVIQAAAKKEPTEFALLQPQEVFQMGQVQLCLSSCGVAEVQGAIKERSAKILADLLYYKLEMDGIQNLNNLENDGPPLIVLTDVPNEKRGTFFSEPRRMVVCYKEDTEAS